MATIPELARYVRHRVAELVLGRGGTWSGAMDAMLDELLRTVLENATLAERQRCAQVAALLFVRDPYAMHPDIAFDAMNESAQTAAHVTAQVIAAKILE